MIEVVIASLSVLFNIGCLIYLFAILPFNVFVGISFIFIICGVLSFNQAKKYNRLRLAKLQSQEIRNG